MGRLRIEAGENPRRHEPVAPEGWPPSVDGDEVSTDFRSRHRLTRKPVFAI